LHEPELPARIVWLAECLITAEHAGVPEGEALGVGVAATVMRATVSEEMAMAMSIVIRTMQFTLAGR
jgi:hypothetical protein